MSCPPGDLLGHAVVDHGLFLLLGILATIGGIIAGAIASGRVRRRRPGARDGSEEEDT